MSRVNIEREALDLPLIDLSQAFGIPLPLAHPTASSYGIRSNFEDMREFAYLKGGKMTAGGTRRSEAEDMREFAYLKGGKMTAGGTRRSEAEDSREFAYLKGGKMTAGTKRSQADDINRNRSNNALYGSLLNSDSLALGAIERVNIAHRVTGRPELTKETTEALASNADSWAKAYWQSSMQHGTFWTIDQADGEPNFIEGGQGNGFGFVQSTYHKRHCLANLRMMLSWHIAGDGSKGTDDMNVHAIHCLVRRPFSIRLRYGTY